MGFVNILIYVLFLLWRNSNALLRNPDAGLNTVQIIRSHGYPLGVHEVTTADGYILQMHRIPHGLHNTNQTNKPAVLLSHFMGGNSADWVALGSRSIADQGYDVWLANHRGNIWSRKHISLNPDNPITAYKFWDFSLHELGIYDLPAIIDYILEKTKQPNLYYIGFSQGTTIFHVMCSTRPEYNAKIKLMSAFAPAIFMGRLKNPLARFLTTVQTELTALRRVGFNEFMAFTIIWKSGPIFCTNPALIRLCRFVIFSLLGPDPEIENNVLSVLATDRPSGMATKLLVHYLQIIHTGQFSHYDSGESGNIKRYGSSKPPRYDLSKISAPVALYYSTNDWFIDPQDAEQLSLKLKNVKEIYLVPYEKFSHMDFIWGKNVVPLLYEKVLSVMKTNK